MTATARADFIYGEAWLVTNSQAENASPSNSFFTSPPAPNVTFTVNAINFDSRSGGTMDAYFTLGSFLTHGGATILTGSAPDLATFLSYPTPNATQGTLFRFTPNGARPFFSPMGLISPSRMTMA